nr:MAK10-like protein [Tanacetum cinerariifolium]
TAKLRNNILMFQQHHEESLSEAWTRFKDLLQKVRHHGIDLWPQAINLPQDVPSTSDHRLIELENQAQCLMEAHLAPTQLTQVNKVTTSCEICSGPHDTQNCMEDPKQAFIEYASSCTDEARGRGFLATPNAVIDCRMAKIAVGEGITRPIDPDGEEFTKTLQSISTTRKLSKREIPREIIDLDHFYDT